MNIQFDFGQQNDLICNKIGQSNEKNVTEVSFISPVNEFYPFGMSTCHTSNISLLICWLGLYGHWTQSDTSVTNQSIAILKFQACFYLQPMISRVIAKAGWRGQMGDCTNQMQTHFPSMDMYEHLRWVFITKLLYGATQRSYL